MNDASNVSQGPVVAGPGNGVRRVNNLPIFIIGGVLLAFVLIVAVVMSTRGTDNRPVDGVAAKLAPAPSSLAEQIVGDNVGIVAAHELTVPPLAVPIARVEGDGPPLPPQTDQEDPELARVRAQRLQQLQQALTARTGLLSAAAGRNEVSAQQPRRATRPAVEQQVAAREPPTGAYEVLRRFGGAQLPDGEGERPNNDYAQFANGDGSNRWQLYTRVEAPRTPFTLRAGFVIPAVMISGINSDLPGQIMGQVSQDVYDTATGRYRVIPQGTRLVGTYQSQVAYGQRRVLVAWQRLVFPDGRAMDIGSMAGADSAGYAGLSDRVDNHYLRIFGQAVLLSGVIAGVELSQHDAGTAAGQAQSAGAVMSQALGQSLGEALTQLFRKNLSIAPTLDVRPGLRFNVMVAKDLDFDRPYAPVTY